MSFFKCLRHAGYTALLVLAAAGCAVTPFVPVAVPNTTSLPVPTPKDRTLERTELVKLQKAMPPPYVISPGDVVAVNVAGQPNFSRAGVTVMPDGYVSIAPAGFVKIGGLTFQEAAEALQEKFRKYLHVSDVAIEPVQLKSYVFTIGGMVAEPGIYPFVFGSFRLTDAVAMAKGLQTVGDKGDKMMLADLDNAYIFRENRMLPVDFNKALVEGDPLYNIPIMNGDYIYIPSLEMGKITVLGEVDEPQCIPFQPNMTLLHSIGIAGGLLPTNARAIKVIRGGLQKPVVFTVDIEDLQAGRAMDFPLKPKDIVYVPRTHVGDWNVMISQILPTIQLLNGLAGPFGSPSSFLYK